MLGLFAQEEGRLLMCSCRSQAPLSTAEYILRLAGVLGCLQIRWGGLCMCSFASEAPHAQLT